MPARTAEDRKFHARNAALSRWAQEDPGANAERGQRGLRDRFVREVRAQFPELADETEIARRADCLYRRHMAQVRRKRTERQAAKAGAE